MTIDARVLVADDDPLNRELLKRALESEGCEVTAVDDGMQVLRHLREDSSEFDLLLLDVMMPGMDGYDVLSYVKGDSRLAHLPVIVISAIDDLSSIVKCIELGADDYLTKPFDPVLLRARITSSLGRKRQADLERRYLRLLEDEEARADRLILNILPSDVARRLKGGETLIADGIEDVSVLFADLVGFTALAAGQTPSETVTLLNNIVTRFDQLSISFGLEKIKTIGDAYLAVGGIGEPRDPDHLEASVRMAIAMLREVSAVDASLQLRVGIHVGPVVAGIIGTHKFSYDIWGDTVNVASRMESHGAPGQIHVSDNVFERLCSRFSFEHRGKTQLKNRGAMETYFVEGPRRSVT